AMRVPVMDDIKPVAGPAFAIMRRRKELVDQMFVSLWIRISDKTLDLFRSRRKTQQIKIDTANECAAVCAGRWGDVFGFEFCNNKAIDGILAGFTFDFGNRRTNRTLERPPLRTVCLCAR